jgi:hypothetical protein
MRLSQCLILLFFFFSLSSSSFLGQLTGIIEGKSTLVGHLIQSFNPPSSAALITTKNKGIIIDKFVVDFTEDEDEEEIANNNIIKEEIINKLNNEGNTFSLNLGEFEEVEINYKGINRTCMGPSSSNPPLVDCNNVKLYIPLDNISGDFKIEFCPLLGFIPRVVNLYCIDL